jgi:hypothetical protein
LSIKDYKKRAIYKRHVEASGLSAAYCRKKFNRLAAAAVAKKEKEMRFVSPFAKQPVDRIPPVTTVIQVEEGATFKPIVEQFFCNHHLERFHPDRIRQIKQAVMNAIRADYALREYC